MSSARIGPLWTRTWLIMVLALAVLVALAPAGQALTTDQEARESASLSDVTLSGRKGSAVLTVSPSGDTVDIDQSSVRIEVGGTTARKTAVTSLTRNRRSVMLLIDTSGSMGRQGIAAAVSAARTFLGQAPSDVAVGLAIFSDRATLLTPPTRKRTVVSDKLDTLNAKGETALYDGLALAVDSLGNKGSRTLLLLSDGGDTVSEHSLAEVARAVKGHGIRLDAVAFRSSESDNSALRRLARAGHGRVVKAANQQALTTAFTASAKALAGQVKISFDVPDSVEGLQQLAVSGRANGQPFRAESVLNVPRAPSSPSGSRSDPSAAPVAPAQEPSVDPKVAEVPAWTMSQGWGIGAAVAVFLGLFGLGLALAAPMFMRKSKRRIRLMDRYVGAPARAKAATNHGTSMLTQSALRMGDAWAKQRASSARTALLLERADLPVRVNEWYVLRAVSVVVSFALFWVWWHGSLIGAVAALVVGVGVGLIAPMVYLKIKAGMRARKFEAQLPDVLTLVASSLSTGFSLAQAIDALTHDAAEPSAKEFSRALAETRIGSDIEDSLDRLAVRMDSTNLRWTVMAIRIQRQVGGNLAETLRTTAGTLRDREALKRQVKALSAEGKLSAYILIALPIGLFGYMMMVNREYISLLWSSMIGIGMLVAGLISLTIGIFWMRKVVVVEV